MGNATAIDAEGVSKKYLISHLQTRRDGTLRDALAGTVSRWRAWWQRRPFGHEADPALETFWALRDISFTIPEGQVLGVIGRNGAGKSTLLKILSRITAPTTGRIRIEGRVASLLEVGTGFHPELTGRENIYLNGAILGMTKAEIERKFDEIVAFGEIERFLDTPVKRYSSGMYMRLAFAVAAHLEPEILLVDEVLAVGDATFQKKCLGKMSDVSRSGRTVVFISHNMGAVQALCQAVLVLDQGRIVHHGDVEAGLNLYLNLGHAQKAAQVDLTNVPRPGRPRKFATIRSIGLCNDDGTPTTLAYMGQPLRIRTEIDFHQPGNHYEIGIAITSVFGVYVHYLVSNWEGFDTIEAAGPALIEARIPKVLIYPGEFFLTLWVKVQGSGVDDQVEEALRFSVEEGQVTPQPAYFHRYSHGTQVHTPSEWRRL